MKNALKFISLFLLLTSGCDFDDGSSFEILSQSNHPDSKYRIVVEDYNYYYWAVLYEENSLSPITSCIMGTTRAPLKDAEMPGPFNGNPPVSVQYASKQAAIKKILKESIQFQWHKDGNVAVILVQRNPICMLDGLQRISHTKAVKKAGPYGTQWDQDVFLTKMKDPK